MRAIPMICRFACVFLGSLIVVAMSVRAEPQTHVHEAQADPRPAPGQIAPVLDGLGDYHHPVTTKEPPAQAFFDQGLRLAYAFNHREAHRAFSEAARLDPNCAMAYWGQALVLGPNLNMPMSEADAKKAYEAVQKAMELHSGVSDKERDYIEALAKRYAADPKAERAPLDEAYAEGMRKVAEKHPDDPDAQTLYGDALMNLSPWYYWTKDGKPREHTPTFVGLFEDVIRRFPDHAGAHHYYIHAVEASNNPERALASAEKLDDLMPGAGHLVHMPSHIYIRTGRYADAAECNERAIRADDLYITQCRSQGLYPMAYHPHNIHFLWAAATLDGRSELAIDAARRTAEAVAGHGGHEGMSLETFEVPPLYALVRFGKWDDILQAPRPDPEKMFLTGVWHYARGAAYAAKGDFDKAQEELAALQRAKDDPKLGTMVWLNPPASILEIAVESLAGEIEAARGNKDGALARLERAVRLQDALPYTEPPDWHYSVRQSLGATLLEAGRPVEAEVVYWDDLRRVPENGWALFGLLQSLRAQGDARKADAEDVEKRFREAWLRADVNLASTKILAAPTPRE